MEHVLADVLFYIFSEINFIKPQVIKLKLDTAFNRLASRFKKVTPYFGNVFLDSSAAGGGSFVDEFVDQFSDPETTLVVRPSIWEVKCDSGIYGNPTKKIFSDRMELQVHFNKGGEIYLDGKLIKEFSDVPKDLDLSLEYEVDNGWFSVYLGDSTRDAFIVHKDTVLEPDLDQDRFLRVPMELFTEFRLNLELSLQDHAGISTKASNVFIQDREALPRTFKMPMRTKEVIEIDFYDRKDSIMNHLREAIKFIPKEKVLSIRFDIGVVSDYTGLAISYFDDWEVMDKKNKTRVPKFCTPIACAIGRKQGQETSIRMMYEFIKDLSKEFEIGAVTADQFQSRY
jgi:hypothetical protein